MDGRRIAVPEMSSIVQIPGEIIDGERKLLNYERRRYALVDYKSPISVYVHTVISDEMVFRMLVDGYRLP